MGKLLGIGKNEDVGFFGWKDGAAADIDGHQGFCLLAGSELPNFHIHDPHAAIDDLVMDLGAPRFLFLDRADFLFGPIGGDGRVAGDSVARPARRLDDHPHSPSRSLRLPELHPFCLSALFELGQGRGGRYEP